MNSSKKTRITRYCPKVEDINFNLLCEWQSCDYTSDNMDDYLKHIDNHLNQYHLNANPNLDCKWADCEMDHSKFDSISAFERHIRYHAFHTKLKFIGKLVIDNFNEKSSNPEMKLNKNVLAINQNHIQECLLDTQSRNLIPELPYKFECSWDKCEYNTDNPELFYRHIKEHVVEIKEIFLKRKIKGFKCLWNDCKTTITNQNRLIEHMRHHSQEKLVACYVCGALFASFTKYIDHCGRSNASSSSKDNIKFQCSHCNKKFLTNNLLKEHIRKHVNKYKCPKCDMTSINKNDLNKHILYKHTNERPFKCTFCSEYEAKTEGDLNKHIQLKHSDNYEYECNNCDDFKTKDLNLMKKHMMKYHLNQSNLTYMYQCHECEKTYSCGSTLSTHLKTVHKYKWPSGHSRFRYRLDNDGYYRLQTLRYESVELVEQINREKEKNEEDEVAANNTDAAAATAASNFINQELVNYGDGRENDFDDEEIDLSLTEEEEEEEEESDEDLEDNDDDDDEFQFNVPQTSSYSTTTATSTTFNHQPKTYSFDDTTSFKDFLIKRLINDDNEVNSKKRQRPDS